MDLKAKLARINDKSKPNTPIKDSNLETPEPRTNPGEYSNSKSVMNNSYYVPTT